MTTTQQRDTASFPAGGGPRLAGLWVMARPAARAARTRTRVVVAGTAFAGGLLLVALAIGRVPSLQIPTSTTSTTSTTVVYGVGGVSYDPRFSPLVTSAEIKVGVLTGVLLLTAAAFALIGQALTTGGDARRRTSHALRLTGATPGDLRRINALDLAGAGLAGGIGAGPVYLLLWAALGPAANPLVRLLPDLGAADVLAWVAVTAGCVVLAAAAGAVTATPPTWRLRARWVALGAVAAIALLVLAVPGLTVWDRRAGVAAVGLIVALLLGLALSLGAGWAYNRAARLMNEGTAEAVLTGAGLTAVAAPVGTAAAVCLLAGTAIGVSSTLLAATLNISAADRYAGQIPGVALTAGAAGLALLIAVATATLGAVDDLATHRRTLAATAALGVEPVLLRRVQARRLRIATVLPTTVGAVAGALFGTAITGAAGELTAVAVATVLGVLVATAGLMWALSVVITRLLQPALRAATDPHVLRVA